jgi:hypothetical protein
MWIVWFVGGGSWRHKVTVWLPLPKEPEPARHTRIPILEYRGEAKL